MERGDLPLTGRGGLGQEIQGTGLRGLALMAAAALRYEGYSEQQDWL